MFGFLRNSQPTPQMLNKWVSLCQGAKDIHLNIISAIRECEHGEELVADIDQERLFAVICSGCLVGLYMNSMTPDEGRRYLKPFSHFVSKFVAERMPELYITPNKRENFPGASFGDRFEDVAINVMPEIIARTGVWRSDVDTGLGGDFAFGQAITAFVIREDVHGRYVEELPGVGKYMRPLPVNLFNIYCRTMEYGRLLEGTK